MEPTDSTHCGNLTDEQRAILGNQAAAVHPQPIDYGLTHDDMRIHRLGSFDRSGLKYKEENKWFGWKSYLAIWFVVYIQGFIIYAALHPEIPGGWTWNNEHAVGIFLFRDLFGVMHHSNSDFGIIVSLGGFTKGAIEFARNKRIFLLDCSDLIAMQEGQDVLAKNFPADPTP